MKIKTKAIWKLIAIKECGNICASNWSRPKLFPPLNFVGWRSGRNVSGESASAFPHKIHRISYI
jgi:hypothetical protein